MFYSDSVQSAVVEAFSYIERLVRGHAACALNQHALRIKGKEYADVDWMNTSVGSKVLTCVFTSLRPEETMSLSLDSLIAGTVMFELARLIQYLHD